MSRPSDTPKTRAKLCVVCGRACAEHERTTEGTYLHTACSVGLAPELVARGLKGGQYASS